MAKVWGKCPHCGEVVPVNDEREVGHCAKCGQPLDVQQSIRAYQLSGGAEQASAPQGHREESVRDSTLQRRQAREDAAAIRAQAANAAQKIQEMFQMCSSEQDFLMLRSKVLQMSISDSDKAGLLAALDSATKQRLSATLALAEEYEKKQKESPGNLLLGCIFLVIIGFVLQKFIPFAGIASVVLAAFGFWGSMTDQKDPKKAELRQNAAALISAYREQGYKI